VNGVTVYMSEMSVTVTCLDHLLVNWAMVVVGWVMVVGCQAAISHGEDNRWLK
jgi:hypothetical protein